jgi:peptidyl-prolyl cis-trans isomerase C
MLNNIHNDITEEGLERSFGSGFGSKVIALPIGEWTGPIESSYGMHIVKITERTESRIPELKEVLQKVITDMSYENRKAAEVQFYSELVPRYKVVYDEAVIEALGGEIN